MTQDQKIIRAKVGLLELAKQLGNVSQACKMMGYSRDSFYRIKELYDKGGELALQEISRKKPILKTISPAGVRWVWQRHDLTSMKLRLKALQAKVAQDGVLLTEAQIAREGQGRQGGARRVRERMPRLLRRPGYLLCRHPEGRGPSLSADRNRRLCQGRFRQAL
jgi:hypothetical protein